MTRLMFFDPTDTNRQSQYVELIVDLPADRVRKVLREIGEVARASYHQSRGHAITLVEAAPMFIRATTCTIDFSGLPCNDYEEWLATFGERADDEPNAPKIAWDVRAWRELVLTVEETPLSDDNPFHPESPEGRAWDAGDRSSIS